VYKGVYMFTDIDLYLYIPRGWGEPDYL